MKNHKSEWLAAGYLPSFSEPSVMDIGRVLPCCHYSRKEDSVV